jgi:hypothetical protein
MTHTATPQQHEDKRRKDRWNERDREIERWRDGEESDAGRERGRASACESKRERGSEKE